MSPAGKRNPGTESSAQDNDPNRGHCIQREVKEKENDPNLISRHGGEDLVAIFDGSEEIQRVIFKLLPERPDVFFQTKDVISA